MKNRFLRSLATSAISIVPIVIVVLVLSLSDLAPIGNNFVRNDLGLQNYWLLGIGTAAMIVGMTFFQDGAAKGLTKVGEYMGASLSKQKHLWVVILFAFLLGALITCAEPSILIVADQVSINKWVLISSIAAGVGLFVVVGILRIVYRKSLNIWYLSFYLIVFLFICLLQVDPRNHDFLPFIFDAGGITTGSATVPFILALGAGVATVRGGNKSRDSSFGLVGLASVGPIITMTILILVSPSGFSDYVVEQPQAGITWYEQLYRSLVPNDNFSQLGSMIEVLMALLPIIVIFLVYELIYIKLPAKQLGILMVGFLVSYIGLVLFLTAINAVMAPIGLQIGQRLGEKSDWLVIFISFALGLLTIVCEPAVHVLTEQIEEVSDGQLKKFTVLLTLSIGVGVAVALSMIRAIYKFSIMYYIIPGYAISLLLMFATPDIFTAIAFDSGGTASGPMSVSFILPVIIGVYSVRNNLTSGVEFYADSFGVVALIALTPIIAIQVLGLSSKFKQIAMLRAIRAQISDSRNDEIIHFN